MNKVCIIDIFFCNVKYVVESMNCEIIRGKEICQWLCKLLCFWKWPGFYRFGLTFGWQFYPCEWCKSYETRHLRLFWRIMQCLNSWTVSWIMKTWSIFTSNPSTSIPHKNCNCAQNSNKKKGIIFYLILNERWNM